MVETLVAAGMTTGTASAVTTGLVGAGVGLAAQKVLAPDPPDFSGLETANTEAETAALAREEELEGQRESRERALASTRRGRRSLLNVETGEVGVRSGIA